MSSLTIPPAATSSESESELIPVARGEIGGIRQNVVDARALHTFLQVGKRFATWITERIEQCRFQPDQDFRVFPGSGKNPQGGRPTIDYAVSLDMAKHLAMMERNEVGDRVRRYFIAMERRALELLEQTAALPAPESIGPADQRRLQNAIAQRFPEGKHRPYAWGRFNNHFRLGRYIQLPTDRIDEALAYVAQMPVPGGGPTETERERLAREALRFARFVTSIDHQGNINLREIPASAVVIDVNELPALIGEPMSGTIPKTMLPAIIKAVAERMG